MFFKCTIQNEAINRHTFMVRDRNSFENFCFADVLDRNCFDQPKQSRCFNGHLADNNRTSDG